MTTFIFASNNNGKISEMHEILKNSSFRIISQSEAGLSIEAEESGFSYEENALIKGELACKMSNRPVIADDSGVELEALNGKPGIFSARYGGDKCKNFDDRIHLLQRELGDKQNRNAKYVTCIACVFPNGNKIITKEELSGIFIENPRGTNGFAYDCLFEIPEYGKTLAEFSKEEKSLISARGKAMRKFIKEYKKYYNN